MFNLLLSVVVFFMFGGRELLRRRGGRWPEPSRPLRAERGGAGRGDRPRPMAGGARGGGRRSEVPTLDRDKVLTLIGIVTLIVVALAFDVDVGFVALSIAAVLSLISPQVDQGRRRQGGVADRAADLRHRDVRRACWRRWARSTGSASRSRRSARRYFAALLICYVGGAVSAFASTTGILGALIPLAVPFLETGAVGAVGLIIALSISSSVVDSSPFSTSGALTVANTPRGEARLRVQAADAVGHEHGR